MHNSVSQDIIQGILIVNANTEEARPTEGKMVKSEVLLDLFGDYGVTSYTQSMPFARTPSLHNVYKIEFTGDQQDFIDDLTAFGNQYYSFIDQEYESYSHYQPADSFWGDGKLWHLYKIQADSAWDITRSSDSIDICVMDAGTVFTNHPDLTGKFNPMYDIYTHDSLGFDFSTSIPGVFKHATGVSCFAAGETTETGETANGKLASIGFNTEMMFTNTSRQLERALYASTVMKAEVITISSFSTGCHHYNLPDSIVNYYRDVFNEIFENGTVVVVSAGNGAPPCYNEPPGTFNGYIDERIIQVSGTDSTDHFGIDDGNGGISTFSHYSAVDLCAPGYSMYGPDGTLIRKIDTITGDTTYVPNDWPYYHNISGTSFSTPIVAGVAALIKSINPCLAPEDVQTILKSTTDTIVDASSYVGTIGTGRLNAYKAVKLAYESYSFQNYTIQSGENLTWNDVHFIDTLYLEPNSSLTINENCFFNAGGHILIDTLAKLNVNNATLTTTCHNMWYGIQVWGKTEASQYPDASYNYIQGRLVLNNATIKNAYEAVSLWKDGDFSSTGGYVIAENSTFINNRRSVAFMSYHNYHPISLNPDRNFSRFENCDFTVNEDYLGDSPFHGMVSLWDVEGVIFQGCDFINNRDSIYSSTGNLINDSLSGFGLWSVNAGFEVGSRCCSQVYPCPAQDVDSSRFELLEYGIHALNTKSANTISVKSSIFNSNITGIYTSALLQPTIIFNSFYINPVNINTNKIYGGVYLDNYTSGFILEENYFSNHQGATGSPFIPVTQSIGLCVNNSGSENNSIYNNKFEDLYVGVLAQNENRSKLDGETGLEIKCNEFFNIQFDIAVTADMPSNITSGIKSLQGASGSSITNPANNIFSPYVEQSTLEAWDIYTETENTINYWYNTNQNGYDLKPDSVTQTIVKVFPNFIAPLFTLGNACPSNFTSGGGLDDLKSLVNDMGYKTDSINNLLALLVDGGDTETTSISVETAYPDQTMEVRADLLSKSPYLSDTVIIVTVQQEEALPSTIVTEILTANPQSAKSDHILDEVYAREDITNSQIDQIEANKMVIGAKESLEIEKSRFNMQREYALNRLIANYKYDTTVINSSDSIIALLNTQNYVSAKQQLAFEYFSKGNFQLAQNTLDAIPNDYELDSDALSENTQLNAYLTIIVQLAQSGKNIYQLTSAQKAGVYNIYQSSNGRAGAWAMNILCTADTLSYKENYILPTIGTKTGTVKRMRPNNDVFEKNQLRVYPNPANDYIIVEYELAGDIDNATIKIIDNNGFIRQTIMSENNHEYAVINTQSLESGTYICHVSANNKLIGVAKFVILH